MSAKAIYEATGKGLLNKCLDCEDMSKAKFATVYENTDWDDLISRQHPWLENQVSSEFYNKSLSLKQRHFWCLIIIVRIVRMDFWVPCLGVSQGTQKLQVRLSK